MKKLFLILTIFITACSTSKKDDPLIVPPNFSEMPDLKNPEKPSEKQKDIEIEKLKDLLLKSE